MLIRNPARFVRIQRYLKWGMGQALGLNGRHYQPQLVMAGFLNHQQYLQYPPVSQTNATASSCSWKSCSASAKGNLLLAALCWRIKFHPQSCQLSQPSPRTQATLPACEGPALASACPNLVSHSTGTKETPLMKEIYPYLEHVALFNPRRINIGPCIYFEMHDFFQKNVKIGGIPHLGTFYHELIQLPYI